jgi:hypothetical protein
MIDEYGAVVEWWLAEENRRKICSSGTSSTTSLTWSHPGMNPRLGREKPVLNRLWYSPHMLIFPFHSTSAVEAICKIALVCSPPLPLFTMSLMCYIHMSKWRNSHIWALCSLTTFPFDVRDKQLSTAEVNHVHSRLWCILMRTFHSNEPHKDKQTKLKYFVNAVYFTFLSW